MNKRKSMRPMPGADELSNDQLEEIMRGGRSVSPVGRRFGAARSIDGSSFVLRSGEYRW